MSDKYFEYWKNARKQGFLVWTFKNTAIMSVAYIVFNILAHYLSSPAESILIYVQENIPEYAIIPCIMFFVNWGVWIYRESKFKAESQRRNTQ